MSDKLLCWNCDDLATYRVASLDGSRPVLTCRHHLSDTVPMVLDAKERPVVVHSVH